MATKITEAVLDVAMVDAIETAAVDAAVMLQLDLSLATADEIVAAVDRCTYQMQQGQGPIVPENDDPALLLGSLWGQQLVREFGWSWAGVTFHEHNDSQAVGVFSADRSLAIYPFHFVWGCLENNAPVTILLAFNLLQDGTRIPTLPLGGYENVMDNVHHIVPRE